MNCLISVIMPVYNSSRYLEEAIQSVINQNYQHWELICVDDGSTDDSLEILERYQDININIKVYSQKNSGPAQARKVAISKSEGEYICYLDSDDKYSKDYLYETLKQALITNADVTMPILISGWNSEKEYNFNDRNNLQFGQVISPRCAFLRTFPWSLHGLSLYKAAHIKKYALTEISDINNFNADEYLTRYLLLFAKKIVISRGKYFHRLNESSITQTFTIRQIGAIKTNSLLFDLAIKEDFPKNDLHKLANEIMISNSKLKYNLINNKEKFQDGEFQYFFNSFKDHFKWMDFIKLDSNKTVMYYIFYKLPLKPSIFLATSRKILTKYSL